MSRILGIVVFLIALAFGISWYHHRATLHALNSGEVFVRTHPSDNTTVPAIEPPVQPVSTPEIQGVYRAATSPQHSAAIPVTDSIPRNPLNGQPLAGNGRYQLYRQGDLTWRLDTDTGFACVLLATDAQWSRLRVFHAGCNSVASASATGN